jgi:CubicO group peptidase (beta-lactamase class C family)
MTNQRRAAPYRLVACALMGLAVSWPSAAQELLFHFPLDGSAAVQGSTAGDARLYVLDDGPPPATVPGKFGNALYFSGNAAIAMPFELDPVAYPLVTVTAWVKVDSESTGERVVFSAGNGNVPRLSVYGDRAYFVAARGALMYESGMPRDEWVFVAGVIDVGSARMATHQGEGHLVSEGINVSNLYGPSGYRNPDDPSVPFGPYVFVGSHGFGQWRANRMAIDEVRVYAGALSAVQVAALRDVGTPDAGSATLLTSGGLPQPAPGTEGLFQSTTPDIAVEDRPPGPLDLVGAAAGGESSVPLLEAPPTATTGAALDPQLSTPDGLPAQQLEEAIAVAENAPAPIPDPVDAILCESGVREPGSWFRVAGQFPEKFVAALKQAWDCSLPVKVASLNLAGDWIVSTPDQIAHSTGIATELAAALRQIEREQGGLDAADIAETGGWVIVSGDKFEHRDLPPQARESVAQTLASGRRVVSFDFSPDSGERWALVDSAGTVTGQDLPGSLLNALGDVEVSKRQPHHVRFTTSGGWLLLASDEWFATQGVHDEALRILRLVQRSGSRMDLMVFNRTHDNYIGYAAGVEPARPADPIYRIEHQFGGANIWRRMRDYNLAGVSIAVVRDNRIEWARGYGLKNADDPESYVLVDTTFDAASISKPIAAVGLLQLVEDGKISLTAEGALEDIESLFKRANLSDFRKAVRPEASNLIQLLQHCASICYDTMPYCTNGGGGGGAAKYAVGDTLPSLPEMIRGTGSAKPKNRLVRTGNPGIRSVYTSANFMLVQALIEVHGGGFLNHMGRLLDRLDMTNSTYAAPYPARDGGNFARGWNGTSVTQVYAYPEMAAASLVATPVDVAKFVIAVNQIAQDPEATEPLSSDMISKYLGRDDSLYGDRDYPTCANQSDGSRQWGLGVRRSSNSGRWGGNEIFVHGGIHNGYRTQMVGLPAMRSGIVVFMTGSERQPDGDPDTDDPLKADLFFSELRSAVVSAYGL